MKEVDMEIRNIDVYDFAGRSIQYSCSGLPSREVRLKLQSGPMACIIVVETDGGVFSRKLPFQP